MSLTPRTDKAVAEGWQNPFSWAQLARELERELAEARYRPMGDNHHNAILCPYCNPALRDGDLRNEE